MEKPKLATGEVVPYYVDKLQREASEKRSKKDYDFATLIVAIIGATASVIAAVSGIVSIMLR